jgi:hypothetical protein
MLAFIFWALSVFRRVSVTSELSSPPPLSMNLGDAIEYDGKRYSATRANTIWKDGFSGREACTDYRVLQWEWRLLFAGLNRSEGSERTVVLVKMKSAT